MYAALKEIALRLLRAPRSAPDAPAGSHASIEIFRASPRYLKYRLVCMSIVAGIFSFVPIVLLIAALASRHWGPGLVAVLFVPVFLFVLFLAYFTVRIDYDMRYYIVTDRSLRVREGAWTVKENTITHANVQNLRVVQGPLQRLLGIWSLEVSTAGGGGVDAQGHSTGAHVITMAGIENAHEVRDLVLRHLRALGGGAGLGDPDDEDEVAPAAAPLLEAVRELRASAAGLRRAAEAR